jgi:hypothetical protein
MIVRWAMLISMFAMLGASVVLSACAADHSSESGFASPYDDTWFKGRRD